MNGTPALARRGAPRRLRGVRVRRSALEGVAAGLAVIVAIGVVDAVASLNTLPLALVLVGPLVTSTRAGRREVLAVTIAALVAAVVVAAIDHNFGNSTDVRRLVLVAVGGLMGVWIAGIRESREHAVDLLASQAEVGRILASANTLADAAPMLISTVGGRLGWNVGALWTVRPHEASVTCVDVWSDSGIDAEPFLAATRTMTLGRGDGIPGRVWQSGRPTWIFDVLDEGNFPRGALALEAGLGGALAFPIRGSNEILGVVELFAAAPRAPDQQILDLIDALGTQIGDFVERKLAEEALAESEARKGAVLRSALDCVITMDGEGRIVEFNPAAERTLGYAAGEVVGRDLAELIIPPDLRERHRTALARYLATGEGRMLDRRVGLRAMRKDRSEIPIELTITSIAGEPPMFCGYLRDLTERREAEALQQRLAAIVESSDDAILSKDRDLIIRSWNAGAERLYGYTLDEAIGQPIRILIPDDRAGEEVELLERVLRDERVEHYETRRVRKDGTTVDVSLTVSPLREPGGQIVGASVIGRDISEGARVEEQRARLLRMEQEARLRTERAERRATFLAEAQSVLSSSLDYERTLRNLAELAVPQLADWCSIDTLRADGALERIALVHVDPSKQRLAAEIERRYPTEPNPDRGTLRAVLTRESRLISEIPEEMLAEAAQNDEHRRLIEALGLRSAMVVPLLARGRALGAITFVSAESDLIFNEDDLALAEDLAARAAVAIENARLYSERDYIATTLQQSLMPDRLPDIPGVDLAARYRAAGEGNEVGGDFYDIYRTGESTWGIAIGDVRGKGPRAAVVTGLARYTLRAASLSETLPSRVLGTLNEAMVLQPANDRFCTVAFASLEPAESGSIRMTLGVGGHPLPLLLSADGSVETVGSPGTLIGFVPDPEVVDETIELRPGDSLVLYTDGVSEARSEAGLFGEERLVDLLKSCNGLDAAAIAERIETDVLDFRQDGTSDDLAVLVLRVRDKTELGGALEGEQLVPVRRSAE
jgi:PAS domain S-box-containing protein